MKFIKKLSASAIVAMAAMAVVGAGSATAEGPTAACTVNESPCPPEHIYTGHIEGRASNVVLLTSVANISCVQSEVLGNVLGLAEPLIGHLELFDFTNCKTESGTACTVTTIKLGLVEVLRTAENLGRGVSNGGTEEKVVCAGIISCTYGGKPELHVEGGEDPDLVAKGSLLIGSGGLLCPEMAKLDALYELVLPESLYVSS